MNKKKDKVLIIKGVLSLCSSAVFGGMAYAAETIKWYHIVLVLAPLLYYAIVSHIDYKKRLYEEELDAILRGERLL